MIYKFPGTGRTRADIYIDACQRTLALCDTHGNPPDTTTCQRLVFYGVRTVNYSRREYRRLRGNMAMPLFHIVGIVHGYMERLTPRQLTQVFPISKHYDGERYQGKDYFTAMKVLQAHGMDVLIGDAVLDILWEYVNPEICVFMSSTMACMDRIMKDAGEKGILETFIDSLASENRKEQ